MRWSRIFLLGVIGTLSLAALMGLAAVVSVRVNERLIGTDLIISLFSLTCLGASLPRHRGPWRWAAIGTYIVSAIGLVLTLLLIWDTFEYPASEPVARTAGIMATWAIALPAMLLLAMTRFANALWSVRIVTLVLIALLAGEITAAVLLELDEEIIGRIIAGNAILAALGTVSLPILYRLYGVHNPTTPVSTELKMEMVCPRCGERQTIPAGDSACKKCGLKFRLEIEEPRCPGCGYLLYKLESGQCPECGRAVAESSAA